MRKFFIYKRIIFLIVFVLKSQVLSSYTFSSNIHDQVELLQAKVEELEQKTSLGKVGAKLPGGLPSLEKEKGIQVEIDLLYFKPLLGGTAYAYSDAYVVNSLPIRGSIKEIKFDMNLGVRVGIEKEIKENDWGIRLDYTYFKSADSSSSSVGTISNTEMALKGISQFVNPQFDYGKSTGKIVWNDLALHLNDYYFINSKFLLKPMIGLKTSWIKFNQWTRYTGGSNLKGETDYIDDQVKFFGIGPDIGNKAEWFFNNGFSISGLLDLALEYGYFKINYDETYSGSKTSNISLSQAKHQFLPIFDLALNLNYGFYFVEKKSYLKLSLGYETIFFLKMNQSLQLYNQYSSRLQNISEDLAYQGITASACLFF